MKFSKNWFLSLLLVTGTARAVIVDFQGTGIYSTYDYNASQMVQKTFSVAFSYDTAGTILDTYATQQSRQAVSLSLTVNMWDGSVWSHTSNDIRMTMNNGVNGSWDGITVTTKWPLTETVQQFDVAGDLYPVVNFSFELTKYNGGVFTDGDFSLPSSPSFIGDLSTWNVKHAKLYIKNAQGNDVSFFNHPVGMLGEPSPIPEPSTWAALLGAGAMGVAVWHRRRKAA